MPYKFRRKDWINRESVSVLLGKVQSRVEAFLGGRHGPLKFEAVLRQLFVLGFVGFSIGLQAQVKSARQYIDSFSRAAMVEMQTYGVPASITLGQGILESASGNSKLAVECNNHFGIKCRSTWTGGTCLADDDAKDECFRSYPSAMDSYRDHSLFLKNSKRYASLFELPATDYVSWAHGLRLAGYATNPAYGDILIGVIKRYRLGYYDSLVVLGPEYFGGSPDSILALEINGLPAAGVKQGQGVGTIASQGGVPVAKIYKYNDLQPGAPVNPGEILYLKPKRRFSTDQQRHTVQSGEQLRDIAQQYGIRTKSLYRMNQLDYAAQEQVVPGQELVLQGSRTDRPNTYVLPASTNADTTYVRNGNKAYHVVRRGETLEALAQRYGLDKVDLFRWNNLESMELNPGQVLILNPGLRSGIQSQVESSNGSRLVSEHRVQAGETLFAISRLYSISVADLMNFNHLDANGQIRVGQILRLTAQPSESANQSPSQRLYFVKPGDTLFRIAQIHGVTVEQIKVQNQLNSSAIQVGDRLEIPIP
ncbi:MAG: LysM peptidoglycan-binding domain-containing protein [Bacteroidia bacterium]